MSFKYILKNMRLRVEPCDIPLKESNGRKSELLITKFRYLKLTRFSTNFLIDARISISNRSLIKIYGMTLSEAPTV